MVAPPFSQKFLDRCCREPKLVLIVKGFRLKADLALLEPFQDFRDGHGVVALVFDRLDQRSLDHDETHYDPCRTLLGFPVDIGEALGLIQSLRVAAQGLSPVEAIVAQSGAERAKNFGWADPYPDAAALADRRQAAEDATDQMVAARYEVLSDDERTEFVALVESAKALAGR